MVEAPRPEGRWVYQWMLLDAGPLTGLSGVQAELPEQAPRTLDSEVGPVEIVEVFEPRRLWSQGDWQWIHRVRVRVEVPDAQCAAMASPHEPAPVCSGIVQLQERLLRPDPDYSPRQGESPFVVARARQWIGRWSMEDGLRWSERAFGGDRMLPEIFEQLEPFIGAPTEKVGFGDPAARLTIRSLSSERRRPWAMRVSRALDPETGEILAADVFVNRLPIPAPGSQLAEDVDHLSPAWRTRAQQARARVTEMQQARLQLPLERLGRFQAGVVAPRRSPLDELAALPPAVQEALENGEWPRLLDNWYEPASAASSLERVLRIGARRGQGWAWARGYAYPEDVGIEHYESWFGLDALDAARDAPARFEDGLRRHLLLVGVLRALGLEPNPAASRDFLNYPREYWRTGDPRLATASVLDVLPPIARPNATYPGRYDIAALRWLYRDEVAIFDDEAPTRLGNVEIDDVPLTLCGDCGQFEVGERLSNRRFVPSDAAPEDRRVRFAACSVDSIIFPGDVLPYDLDCALGDLGPSLRASFAERWLRWSLALPAANRAQVAYLDQEPRPEFLARARLTLDVLRAAAQAAAHLQLVGGPEVDATTTAALGVNFAAELVSMPEPGRQCPWPDGDDRHYLRARFLPREACDPAVPISSAQARAERQVELPLGPARPWAYYIEDYEVLGWHPGAGLDGHLAIWLPHLLDGGFGAPGVLAELFTPELAEITAAVATRDRVLLRRRDIEALGSEWCPSAPPSVWPGEVRPVQIVPLGDPECEGARRLYPRSSSRDTAAALVAGVLWAGLGERVQVFRRSEPGWDDVDWASLGSDYCEVEHPGTGEIYRAIGAEGPGCKLVDNAFGVREYWDRVGFEESRERPFEMLELARTLRR